MKIKISSVGNNSLGMVAPKVANSGTKYGKIYASDKLWSPEQAFTLPKQSPLHVSVRSLSKVFFSTLRSFSEISIWPFHGGYAQEFTKRWKVMFIYSKGDPTIQKPCGSQNMLEATSNL